MTNIVHDYQRANAVWEPQWFWESNEILACCGSYIFNLLILDMSKPFWILLKLHNFGKTPALKEASIASKSDSFKHHQRKEMKPRELVTKRINSFWNMTYKWHGTAFGSPDESLITVMLKSVGKFPSKRNWEWEFPLSTLITSRFMVLGSSHGKQTGDGHFHVVNVSRTRRLLLQFSLSFSNTYCKKFHTE